MELTDKKQTKSTCLGYISVKAKKDSADEITSINRQDFIGP